jgi:hypothetical protein
MRAEMPNDVPVSNAALAILCQYPLIKTRSDMSFDEYTAYVNDWKIFNKVWAYNYTIRSIGSGAYYQFSSDSERISYRRGQSHHVSVYSEAAAAGAFNNIP